MRTFRMFDTLKSNAIPSQIAHEAGARCLQIRYNLFNAVLVVFQTGDRHRLHGPGNTENLYQDARDALICATEKLRWEYHLPVWWHGEEVVLDKTVAVHEYLTVNVANGLRTIRETYPMIKETEKAFVAAEIAVVELAEELCRFERRGWISPHREARNA